MPIAGRGNPQLQFPPGRPDNVLDLGETAGTTEGILIRVPVRAFTPITCAETDMRYIDINSRYSSALSHRWLCGLAQ
jgi:hypothetical protein